MKDILCIIPYYDYAGLTCLYDNHYQAVEHLESQGVDTLTLEAVYQSQPRLTQDATRLEVEYPLWYKETLINYGIRTFRDQYKYIAWVDSGVLLPSTWVEQALDKLQCYDVLQCFSGGIWMQQGNKSAESITTGYIAAKEAGLQYGKNILTWPSPGGAWIARSSCLQADHFLCDRSIVGGGDSIFVAALLNDKRPQHNQTKAHFQFCMQWQEGLRTKVSSVSYIVGDFVHLWHATDRRRQHSMRHEILVQENYRPRIDTIYDRRGILTYSSNAPSGLVDRVGLFIMQRSAT